MATTLLSARLLVMQVVSLVTLVIKKRVWLVALVTPAHSVTQIVILIVMELVTALVMVFVMVVVIQAVLLMTELVTALATSVMVVRLATQGVIQSAIQDVTIAKVVTMFVKGA